MKIRIRVVFALLGNLFLLACASAPPPVAPPPPPAPTVVSLELEAGADINADSSNQATPVLLKIYELVEPSNFTAADFFALFNNEQVTLANTLVRKQELLLKPGETKTLQLQPQAQTTVLGFLAAFRQLDTAQWRALLPIVPQKNQSWWLKIQGNQLSVVEQQKGH